MDSGPGQCWVCDALGKVWCPGCRFALYCSHGCLKKDKARHSDECFSSSRRKAPCSYCRRDDGLGGTPCPDCLVCSYCSDSCRKMDAKNHQPVCQKAKEKVLEATKKIGEWNRRAKGIPQYLGRLIHAVDYLRWIDNEGSKSQTTTGNEATKNKRTDREDPKRDSHKSRRATSEDLDSETEEQILRMLILGADMKHVLRTLHDTPDACMQGIDITFMDSSPHIMARDLLILYLLMLPDAPAPIQDQATLKNHAEKVVMVFYSLSLDMETHALLCNTLHNLLNMTYKSFLHEMRQQVHIDAVSYTLVQAIWNGWMSFANDPSAMQKLEKIRTLKMSGTVIKDVLTRYLKSCPKEHQKGISDWIKRGSLKKQKGCYFPNVTLTCFSPLKKEYLDRFEDVNPKWSEETEWMKTVSPDEDMIYAPHGIDMIFQDWDFVLVTKGIKKESNVIDMYLKFLTKVFKRSSLKLVRSNQISINFIRANVKDLRKSPSLLKGKFDRIATGIHADLLGTPLVLQELGVYLSTTNTHARLITHHRVWSLCLHWQQDQQAREMCQKSAKNNKHPDPSLMLASRWSTFRHFLQAELLHHLHVIDSRPVEVGNVMPFRDVSHAYNMILSDYTHHLNRIIPFRFRPEKRMVSMVDSRLHSMEWRRIGRSRSGSVPAAALPKVCLETQTKVNLKSASQGTNESVSHTKNEQVPSSSARLSSNSISPACSRENSMSPSPIENQATKSDRPSRARTTKSQRPKSLYGTSEHKSPSLSPECDFWEQQNLMSNKKNKKTIHCSEIPEGIKTRAQRSLEAELRQVNMRAKSAPASPQQKCKSKMVRETADAFERGSANRSTYPETRRHLDTITPSTPVKKLVQMFSKAFAAKDKSNDFPRPFTRRNTFHAGRLSFEHGDEPGSLPKEYTNSLKKSKSRNAVESGVCTLPRNSRPHSIAVSKFSYLEGSIDKDEDNANNTKNDVQGKEKEKKKKEAKQSSHLNPPESRSSRKEHKSPIRSLIAGLNTFSVSPVLPRSSKQHRKNLKDTITIKRDELRLVNLRPGSPQPSLPVSGSPSLDRVECIDWPESRSSTSLDISTEKKSPIDIPRKSPFSSPKYSPLNSPVCSPSYSPRISITDSQTNTPMDSPRFIPLDSPRKYPSDIQQKSTIDSPRTRSVSPSTVRCASPALSAISSSSNHKKKIPQEPEYVAPPLCIPKSPSIMLHAPSIEQLDTNSHQPSSEYHNYSNLITPSQYDNAKLRRLEDIFSPKSSPRHSRENLCTTPDCELKVLTKVPSSGLLVQTIKPDIENAVLMEKVNDQNKLTKEENEVSTKHEQHDNDDSKPENLKIPLKEDKNHEDSEATTSIELSVSMNEEDSDPSELLPKEEPIILIQQNTDPYTKDSDSENEISESSSEIHNTLLTKEKAQDHSEGETGEGIPMQSDEELKNSPTDSNYDLESESVKCEEGSQSSDKSDSPQIIEQLSPVNKMVEHFTEHFQEEHLLERPESPKSYSAQQATEDESNVNISDVYAGQNFFAEGECSIDFPKRQSPDLELPLRKSDKQEKQLTVDNVPPPNEEDPIENEYSSNNPRNLSPSDSNLIEIKKDTCDSQGNSEEKVENMDSDAIPQENASHQGASSLPSKESHNTPVNKMVEKFALEIQAQASPPLPRAVRPHSIGTLIQEDFLRLYSDKPLPDDNKQDDDTQEDLSLTSDCCEETMFDISDDEEHITIDILGNDGEEDIQSKNGNSISSNQDEKCVQSKNNNSIPETPESYKKIKQVLESQSQDKAFTNSPTPSTIKDKDEVQYSPRMQDMNSTETPSPRESRCNELRHEFLQKIRALTDSPIPPSRKKYGEIKATLSKKKDTMLQGEKLFVDDVSQSREDTHSPRLEDMAIVSYTIKIEEESITEQLRTPPITPRDEPGSAINFLADKETQGLDGGSQELCSTELKNDDILDILPSSSSRNASPSLNSERFFTLPRKSKSNHGSSSTSSLTRPNGKKKVIEADISHKMQMLKSSRTGGMDKMSFRQLVKSSIASEDTGAIENKTNIIANDSKVVEFTSSMEVSTEELQKNSDEVEEAIEAISLTSDDEPPTTAKKKITLYSDDSLESDDSKELDTSTRKKNPSIILRRKRLPSSRSPSDEDFMAKYCTDDSDNTDANSEDSEDSRSSNKNNVWLKPNRTRDQLRLSPLVFCQNDELRKSPDSAGLNFNVEIPDTPVTSNTDIRRFMWGSLKRKSKSKTPNLDNKKQTNDFHDSDKVRNEEMEKESNETEPVKREVNPNSDTLQSNQTSEYQKKETKSLKLDATTPTIVAVLPKNRAGSPIVGLRLSQEGATKSKTPPKPPPKPKRNSGQRELSQSAEDFTSTRILSASDSPENFQKDSAVSERPKSWGGVNSLEVMEALATLDASSDDCIQLLSEEEQDDTSEGNNEVFVNAPLYNVSNETEDTGSSEKVEVRPKTGVLKGGRDHSRESRRSLRVSWGDLQERFNTPSPDTTDDDQGDEIKQDDSGLSQEDEDDDENDHVEYPNVTQL